MVVKRKEKKKKHIQASMSNNSSMLAVPAASSSPKSYEHKFPAEIYTNHRSKTYHHGQKLTKVTKKRDPLFFF